MRASSIAPFRRVFVANRGEVAARIAKTCDQLLIHPVFAVSEADERLPQYRDREIFVVGPARAQDSYLHRERLVHAARKTRCTALHPGWGFLSEDAQFAALTEAHGVTFVGPPAHVIDAMSQKSPAKQRLRALGLPVIAGSPGVLHSAEDARDIADAVGYPVLLKAESGGGGRGMRVVRTRGALAEAYHDAEAEARGAFGDGRLYLEKLVTGGRHVELQLLADRYGGVVDLGERDCSIQRRHQKLIEESPAPTLDAAERERVAGLAREVCRAVGYVGVGTMEFLLGEDGNLCFLEMNTRLQVEHGVTELRTGIDLVEAQLRVAAGEALWFRQEDVSYHGAALECRINAEDPAQAFRACPGRLERFDVPVGEGIRVDTHLEVGAEVSPYYDSLLGKVLAWGQDRREALTRMQTALAAFHIGPMPTTVGLHQKILASDAFQRNDYNTESQVDLDHGVLPPRRE